MVPQLSYTRYNIAVVEQCWNSFSVILDAILCKIKWILQMWKRFLKTNFSSSYIKYMNIIFSKVLFHRHENDIKRNLFIPKQKWLSLTLLTYSCLWLKGKLCFLFSSELDAADRQHEMRGGPRREGCHSWERARSRPDINANTHRR